jgi:hypothetical protein
MRGFLRWLASGVVLAATAGLLVTHATAGGDPAPPLPLPGNPLSARGVAPPPIPDPPSNPGDPPRVPNPPAEPGPTVEDNPPVMGDLPPIPPGGVGPGDFVRVIQIKLRSEPDRLLARGELLAVSGDGRSAACIGGLPLRLQRRASGHWDTLARARARNDGTYRISVPDRASRYRVVAPLRFVDLGDVPGACRRAVSRTVQHG